MIFQKFSINTLNFQNKIFDIITKLIIKMKRIVIYVWNQIFLKKSFYHQILEGYVILVVKRMNLNLKKCIILGLMRNEL
jgi:hypothetical protein